MKKEERKRKNKEKEKNKETTGRKYDGLLYSTQRP